MPPSHPAHADPGFQPWLQDAELTPTLRSFREYKRQSNGGKGVLQYSDLHGIPCILILCEKGRMGDTFPETFCCLDLRIRTSVQLSVFVQEFGRLCRYQSVVPGDTFHVTAQPDQQPATMNELQQALCYAHDLPVANLLQSMQELTGGESAYH